MPLLRLKSYTSEVFNRYLDWQKEPTEKEEFSQEGSRLTASYVMVCQTILFFNQSLPDMSLNEWSAKVPACYLLKIDHSLALLEDSRKWAISALALDFPQGESLEMRELIITEIDSFRISQHPEHSDDALTTQFSRCCNLIHNLLPLNRRTRNALIRLIWTYLAAKECVLMAKELSLCDRIDYLRRITNY